MELSYDWTSFQKVFFPTRRMKGQVKENPPFYAILDSGTVISAFCEGESVTDWIGASKSEILARFEHREVVFFDRNQVDQWMSEIETSGHFYDQLEFLKSRALTVLDSDRAHVPKNRLARRLHRESIHSLTQRHFLLGALQGWWKTLFPRSFSLLIRIENAETFDDVLLFVKNGKFEGFQNPDTSSLDSKRKNDEAAIVKYLSERYSVPVQGIFVSGAEWEKWGGTEKPWKKIISALRNQKLRLYPFGFGLRFLLLVRSRFGL